VAELVGQGATVLVNLAASPFEAGKDRIRFSLMASHARRHGLPVIMANQVGGNDELVFDGRSIAVDSKGRLAAHLASFAEEIRVFDTRNTGILRYRALDEVESIHRALVLGVRDYFAKCGFHQAVLGLSGGIDSALVACIAAEALGPENVLGITMPSPYSSRGSFQDSETLAKNLGISFLTIPIADIYQAYRKNLEPSLGGGKTGSAPDVAWENVQARIRGNILMAFSNKMGYMVLSTGNKSELAVGYCTLYGDMSGGLAVISDVPKTMVYKLADHVNRRKDVIPKSIIQKAPSAELRPNQRDQDTLPPYPVLDGILQLYIEERMDPSAIVKRGYKRSVVDWVVRAVKSSEYKRRQAAPGIKVTGKAFGAGRRMPVAARY
jgi:NAD+ synthase (glutamine-hydrolysing)